MIHFFLMAYRPTERSEAKRLATRERILAAALEQVAEGGYASASVQRVAVRAEVATGTVYRHFASKGELFAEVFRRAAQPELDVVAEVSSAPGLAAPQRIAAAAEAFARRALAAPVLAYAQIAEPVDPAVAAERLVFRRGYRDAFRRALDEGVESGEIAPHDSETLAAALVGALGEALVGPLSPVRNGAPRRGHEALVASLVQFCIDAIPKEESRLDRSRAHA